MYRKASLELWERYNLYLYASGIQSNEARAAWKKMESMGWVKKSGGRKFLLPKRV